MIFAKFNNNNSDFIPHYTMQLLIKQPQNFQSALRDVHKRRSHKIAKN